MAFSLSNQSEAAPVPGQGIQGVQNDTQPQGVAPDSSSPFLFVQQRGGEISVNAYLQILLFVIASLSILVSLVLFVYSTYLKSSIASTKQEILTRDASFKDYPISEMVNFSSRVKNLEKLLQEYVSVRSPLKFLEDVVERQVVFDEFSLKKPVNGSGYTVDFAVVTTNYRALIQQLEALNLAQYSKIAPQPKTAGISDSRNSIKVRVSTPVIVQGVTSDQIVFVEGRPPEVSTSTPQ